MAKAAKPNPFAKKGATPKGAPKPTGGTKKGSKGAPFMGAPGQMLP